MSGRVAATAALSLGILAASIDARVSQSSGSIVGVIRYHDGSIIPGVIVRLFREDAKPISTTHSQRDGSYVLADLLPATYRLDVSLPGFKTVACSDIAVKNGSPTVLNVIMMLGEISEPAGGPAADDEQLQSEPTPPRGAQTCLRAGEVPVVIHGADYMFLIAIVDVARAPKTSAYFLQHVASRAYDGGQMQRVSVSSGRTASGFQTRDTRPRNVIEGRTRVGFEAPQSIALPLESTSLTGLRHTAGTLSLVRGDRADSVTSTFMLLLEDDPMFDAGGRQYADLRGAAAFGRLAGGLLEDLRKIGSSPLIVSSIRRADVEFKR